MFLPPPLSLPPSQFICGLSLCCGQLAHLSRDEIQRIVEHYRTPDGRVRYKEFCDLMENSEGVLFLLDPAYNCREPL